MDNANASDMTWMLWFGVMCGSDTTMNPLPCGTFQQESVISNNERLYWCRMAGLVQYGNSCVSHLKGAKYDDF